MTLPGLDVRKKRVEALRRWTVSFVDWELGQLAAREHPIVVCRRCGKNAAVRHTDRGDVWEHVREFWVTPTGNTKSKAIQYCREIEADKPVC